MHPDRQASILTAAAYACIHCHPMAYTDPNLVGLFWEGKDRPPTKKQIRYLAPSGGYRKGIIQRIKQGLEDEDLSPWTGGFWHGLKLSGAVRYSNKHWRMDPDRPELIEDLSRIKVSHRFGKPDYKGRFYLLDCLAIHLPPKGEDDITVLAGLFAGAKIRKTLSGNRSYFVVPETPEVRKVLDYWALAIHNKSRFGYGLSPFYAALLTEHLPVAVACRNFQIKRAVQCPMLPLAYWEVLFGPEGMPLPPRLWSLPYICSDITRKRHKWTHRILHQMAVRLGIAHVQPPMRQLIVNWRSTREMLYNERFELT